MIYTFGDEIHAKARCYTIAFAMDKKFDKSKLVEFLAYPKGYARVLADAHKRMRTFSARTSRKVEFCDR